MAPPSFEDRAVEASEVLLASKRRIIRAQKAGADVGEAEEIMVLSAKAFKAHDFEEASALARRAAGEADRAHRRATDSRKDEAGVPSGAVVDIEEREEKDEEMPEDEEQEEGREEDTKEPERDERPSKAKADDEQLKGGRHRKRQGSLLKRVALWIAAYSIVAMLYIAFFSYPVSPARLEGFAYENSERVYMNFPYTYEIDYVSVQERSVVVILTIRTISIPDQAYSTALKYTKKMTEDYIKQNYGQDVDVEFKSESTMKINGHDAVVQKFDVFKNITVYVPLPPPGHNEIITERVASMTMAAWFCTEEFQSVITGFFHPAAIEPNIAGSIRCH